MSSGESPAPGGVRRADERIHEGRSRIHVGLTHTQGARTPREAVQPQAALSAAKGGPLAAPWCLLLIYSGLPAGIGDFGHQNGGACPLLCLWGAGLYPLPCTQYPPPSAARPSSWMYAYAYVCIFTYDSNNLNVHVYTYNILNVNIYKYYMSYILHICVRHT